MALTVRELSQDEAPLWDQLIKVSPQRSVFAHRWWMAAVTDGAVRLLGCFDEKGHLLGGLPIWPTRTLGVPRLRQPILTPYWGPLLMPNEGKYYTRLCQEVLVLRAFAQALAPWPDVTIACHPTLTNWMPFHWEGFTQTTRYTYRIERITDLPLEEEKFLAEVRPKLRTARKHGLELRAMVDPLVVLEMYGKTMGKQGLPKTDEVVRVWPKIAQAALERRRLFTTAAVDGEGHIHNALAMVWDDDCAYGIFGGGDPQYRHTSGGTLTLWHEIASAAALVPAYDFEGSMLEPVEQFFRKFGGVLTPYSLITRHASPRLNLARGAAGALRQAGQRLALRRKPEGTDAGGEG